MKKEEMIKGYSVDYKAVLKNCAVKMRSSVAIRVATVGVFGAVLVVGAICLKGNDNKNESITVEANDIFVTAGVSTDIANANGVYNGDLTQLVGNSGNNAIATSLAETPQEEVPQGEAPAENKSIQELLPDFSNLGVANVDNYLNIREEPSENGTLCGKLPKNSGCEILEDANGWYKIKSGKVTGYVKSEYLITGDMAWAKADEIKTMTATVDTETLYVREAMSTDCKIVALVSGEEELEVLEQQDNWAKVQVDSDQGYISLDYATLGYQLPKAESVTELKESKGVSSTRVSIVEYAKQFLGNPYVWGGTSLTKGADCSGFTMSIYGHYGVSLPHSSSAQSRMGTKVSSDELKPGDLLFYGSGKSVSHVAMYIGGGKVIHASTEKTGIKISNAFYRTPITIRRYLD